MQDIKELSLDELKVILKQWNEPVFHSQGIFSWIYKKYVKDFSQMSDLSLGLRNRLKEKFYLKNIKVAERIKSLDLTEKLLLRLGDGNLVEAVIIPADKRVTGCVSTQVGCKFACSFCASGLLGFKRNLTCGEILEQVLCLKEASGGRLTHIVFMGTGEPLDNYENLMRAIRLINSSEGLNIGARRITISTAGFTPGIVRLAREGMQIELSVSLHAADNKTRSALMPVNKKYPLKDLIRSCREYIQETNRQVTFEYVMIKGINVRPEDALNLSRMLKVLNCKINLIPANPVKECNIEPPNKLEVLFFKDSLLKNGIHVTLRRSRGQDIQAACGQLRLKYENK